MAEQILVKMENIHKWYGNVHALKGVDFEVRRAEVVGLVGDNGAGKSTLIKILCGIYPPDEGKMFFEGKEVNFSSPKDALKRGIETIHQKTALVDTMDIKRNFYLGRELTKKVGIIKWLDMKKMAMESLEAISKVGVNLSSSNIAVAELSGGQRQGVAIARALHFKSKLLIMDEPTNNLSVKETRRVYQFIMEAHRQGVACIFITHNINDAYPIADRIVVLRLGEKLADLRKEETSVEDITALVTK